MNDYFLEHVFDSFIYSVMGNKYVFAYLFIYQCLLIYVLSIDPCNTVSHVQ